MTAMGSAAAEDVEDTAVALEAAGLGIDIRGPSTSTAVDEISTRPSGTSRTTYFHARQHALLHAEGQQTFE